MIDPYHYRYTLCVGRMLESYDVMDDVCGGGGVLASSDSVLILDGTNVTNCSCVGEANGGGLALYESDLKMNSSAVRGCFSKYGGGIFAGDTSSIDVEKSEVSDCQSKRYGGGVECYDSSYCYFYATKFHSCTAGTLPIDYDYGYGGAINALNDYSNDDAGLYVEACTFTMNTASYGGGVATYEASAQILSSTFASCNASVSGGALQVYYGTADITSVTFQSCSSPLGGAIYVLDATMAIQSSKLQDCTTASTSAILMVDGGDVEEVTASATVESTLFSGNSNFDVGTENDGSLTCTATCTTIGSYMYPQSCSRMAEASCYDFTNSEDCTCNTYCESHHSDCKV